MKDCDIYKIGDQGKSCPTCTGILTLKRATFHWRGTDYSGWVCEPCNALWGSLDGVFEAVSGCVSKLDE